MCDTPFMITYSTKRRSDSVHRPRKRTKTTTEICALKSCLLYLFVETDLSLADGDPRRKEYILFFKLIY